MSIVEEELYCDESKKLPASWYMFIVILQKLIKNPPGYLVLPYKHCKYIADKLHRKNIDDKSKLSDRDFKVMLHQLTNVFGIVLYFEELQDAVICDPGFVYKSISDRIFSTFRSHSDKSSQKLRGIFEYKDLDKCCENKQLDIEKAKLIALLEHLSIIVKIQRSTPTERTAQEDEAKYSEAIHPDQEYLIPCVLEDTKGQDLKVQIQDTQACSIVPLRIYFDCGFTPMGGFCYLFTNLMSNKKDTWNLLPDNLEDGDVYWRNKVTFDVEFNSRNYLVTLLSTDEYYEIHIIHFVSEQPFYLEKDGRSICTHVWDVIHTILEQSPYKSLETYKTACICTINHPKSESDEHVMKFTSKPHKCERQIKARCCKKRNKQVVEIKEAQPSVPVWFKVCTVLTK